MNSNISFEQLQQGLKDTLSTNDLRILLREQFDIKLEHLAPPGPLPVQIFNVIETADRAGWLPDLVEAIYRRYPGNQRMADLYRKLGLTPSVSFQNSGMGTTSSPSEELGGLERAIAGLPSMMDFQVWSVEATRVASRVCRIESEDGPISTGFLVSPDTILTCYHGLESRICGASASDLRFRFEYKVLADGTRSDGVVAMLHPTDWLIDSAPYASAELRGDVSTLPSEDELGFALVKLDRPIGLEPPARAKGGAPRGWIWIPDSPPYLSPNSPVIIAHYPSGQPLKLSIGDHGMLGPNGNSTRILYQVDTEPGSAGAPCFDIQWRLFAIHQYAARANDGSKAFKHGIPTFAIRNRLLQLGKASALGGPI